MTSSERVLVEIIVAAPIDAVWQSLRDPAEIRRWFGWDYPGLDEEVLYIFSTHATASEADRTIRVDNGDRFELEARGDRTLVRLIRAAPASGASWEGIYDDVDEGWLTFLHQLRFALERHCREDRRTVFVSGHAAQPGAALIDTLGLAVVAKVPAGAPYEATTANGEALTGTVWFRSAHQLGVSVDNYGNGLLVVAERPPDEKSPHGGGMVIITTYGFDDGSFDRLRERWASWWRARYEPNTSHTP